VEFGAAHNETYAESDNCLLSRGGKRMEPTPEAVLDAALRLPEEDRLAIVARLLDTLPPEDITLAMDDPLLVDELNRRFADSEGATGWSDLKAEG